MYPFWWTQCVERFYTNQKTMLTQCAQIHKTQTNETVTSWYCLTCLP